MRWKPLRAAACAAVVLAVGVRIVGADEPPGTGKAVPEPSLPVGSTVELFRPGGAGNVLLARNPGLISAFNDRSPGALGRFIALREAGNVAYVPNGSRGVVTEITREARRVRITEGPPLQVGVLWWVEERYLRDVTLRAKVREAPKAPEGYRGPSLTESMKLTEAGERMRRADSGLTIAKNLEKSGKREAALGWYRRVAKDYPGTPQAKEAAARVKALGGK
jgi:hypothetical protein